MTGASFAVSFMLAGRSGSVSRRDHNPKTRKRAQLAWALKSEGKVKPIPSRSSGERGLGGEGLLSEKPPLPPESLVSPYSSANLITRPEKSMRKASAGRL